MLVPDASTCDFLDGPWHPEQGAVAVMALPLSIGERAEAEQANVRRLTELDQLKRDYIAGITHDLKNPLAGLIDNALRYSDPSTTVAVRVRGADGTVTIRVRDRGPGIPPEDRERVFQRFGRSASGRDAGSTGPGSFITRSIARGHGGDVAIEDPADGVGTAVVVRLPCERPAEEASAPQ